MSSKADVRRVAGSAYWREVRALASSLSGVDRLLYGWVRTHGSTWLRRGLGLALTARAERLGVSETCACGQQKSFSLDSAGVFAVLCEP